MIWLKILFVCSNGFSFLFYQDLTWNKSPSSWTKGLSWSGGNDSEQTSQRLFRLIFLFLYWYTHPQLNVKYYSTVCFIRKERKTARTAESGVLLLRRKLLATSSFFKRSYVGEWNALSLYRKRPCGHQLKIFIFSATGWILTIL